MVAKKKKDLPTDDEVDEIMEEKTDHSTHVRTKNYDKNCYWCIMFGFIRDEPKQTE